MREPGLLMPSWSPHPPSYFGMPVPGICSNSSHPVGIGMSPPSTRPSLVFTACLCLSYIRQHMYEAANADTPQPTCGAQPTHFTGLVTTKSFPSCSASWCWQTTAVGYTTAGPKTTQWITGDCKLLLITAERSVYSAMLSELTLIRSTSLAFLWHEQMLI